MAIVIRNSSTGQVRGLQLPNQSTTQSMPQQAQPVMQNPSLLGSIGLGLFDAAINKPFIQPIGTALEGARAWGLNFQKPDDMVLQSAMNKKNKNQPLTFDEQKALGWNDKMLGYQPQFMSEKRFNEIGNENAAVTGLKQGLLTGSALMPGASTAMGGIGRAVAGGAMYGAGETSDWSNIPELLQNTAVGGLMGGGTEGLLQGVSKGIGKMSGGKGLGGSLKNKAQNIEKGMLDVSKLDKGATSLGDKQQMIDDIYSILKTEAPDVKFGKSGKATVKIKGDDGKFITKNIDYSRKESLKAAQEVAYSALSDKYNKLITSNIGKKKIDITSNLTDIKNNLFRAFSGTDLNKTTGVVGKNIDRVEKMLAGAKTIAKADAIKKELAGELARGKVFKAIKDGGEGAINPSYRVQFEAWKALDNAIASKGGGLKDLSTKMSKLHIASEDMADFINKKGDGIGLAAFIYTPRFETTGGVMGMKGWAADQLNTLGNALEGSPATTKMGQIAQSATSQLPARSVSAAAINDITGNYPTDTGVQDMQDTGATGDVGTQDTGVQDMTQGMQDMSGNQSQNNVSLMDEYKQNQQMRLQGMLYLMSKGMKVTEAKAIVDFMAPELDINQMIKIREFEQSSGGGGKTLPAGQLKELGDMEAGLSLLPQLDDLYNETKGSFGPIKGRLSGANPWNVQAQDAKQITDLVRQIIGKALEGGVLRKEDEYKYKSILPQLADTPDVVDNKIARLKDVLAQRQAILKKTFQTGGYDPYSGVK